MSNLLKDAIADAKAVRATALANAKVFLEEALTPRFQAVFAEKLKEETLENDPSLTSNPTSDIPVNEEEQITEEEIDSLIKELESEVDADEETPEVPSDLSATETPDDSELSTEEPSMDDASEVPGTPEPGAPIPAGVPVIIQPVDQAATPTSSVPPTTEPEPPMSTEEPEMSSDIPGENEDEDEEIDINELLESLSEEVDEEVTEEAVEESAPVNSSAVGGKVGGSDNKKPSADASSSSHIESAGKDRVGGGEGYKSGPQDPTTASRPNSKGSIGGTKKMTSESKETGVPNGKVTAKDPTEAPRPNSDGEIENTPALKTENISLKRKLDEAYKTVNYIKGQLNEINLLNAKLLYTNKLLKEFSMNNEQKMRIIEMFDLAKNTREVKLTYATIAESLSFSANTTGKSKKFTSVVQNIAEGMASKPVGTPNPVTQTKGIISESNGMASRFQKLAGIRKK